MCVKPIEKREGKSFISVSKRFSGWQCQVVFIWLLLGFSKCFTYAENSSKEKQKLFFFFFFLKKETKLSFRRKSFNLSKKRGCVHVNCVQQGLEATCCHSGRLVSLKLWQEQAPLWVHSACPALFSVLWVCYLHGSSVCVCVCVCVCM